MTKKGYVIVCYHTVTDEEALQAYAKLANAALEETGGRYLVRGRPAAVYEAGKNERTVVLEFDSLERALAARDNPAYQAALRALGDGAVRDMRVVEGID
jgi:uncharacterized protein (DUF1330 family)